jgi:serine O-acetyltransferase
MFKLIRRDIKAVVDRDPAVRSVTEILLCYPGLHALWGYRLSHWLWTHKRLLLARWVSHLVRWLTGIEIHPGAQIGPGFFIDHGMGVVIGETTEIGVDVTLYHGVTLGGATLEKGKRHPTLEDRVVVGAGAKILGPITIGAGSRIGANAVVVKPVPPDSVVVGVPGQIIKRGKKLAPSETPDFDHTRLPDVMSKVVQSLTHRIEQLEQLQNNGYRLPPKVEAEYYLDDFSI